MARYPKRQKVKRYRRSFYTREMRLKKGIGIAVLVVAVLAAAWVAAPHVLDWATHTWYTVVRDRDLSASSAVSESASSGAQSTAASEPAASSVPEKEPEPEVKGTDIVTGLWAEVDVATLTDEAAIRSAARQLKAQGMTYAILTLKDTAAQLGVNAYGVYIVEVVKGGPADKAGLQAGDRIVSVDGSEVATQSDLGTLMQNHKAGDTIEITVARGGQMQTVTVTLGEKGADNS